MHIMRTSSSQFAPVTRSTIKFLICGLLLLPLPGSAQTPRKTAPVKPRTYPKNTPSKPKASPEADWTKDLDKFPGLLPEFGKLAVRLAGEVHAPPARTQSKLMDLVPGNTVGFMAIPNYGDAAQQALRIFREQREQSPVLRDWWQHGAVATEGPKFEQSLEKFIRLASYLGDEVIFSFSMDGKGSDGDFLLMSEVKNPGLKSYLEQFAKDVADPGEKIWVILDSQQLASAKDAAKGTPYILSRPDLIVMSSSLSALRALDAKIGHGEPRARTAFTDRVAQAYQNGAGVIVAIDAEKILSSGAIGTASNPAQKSLLENSGLLALQYLVMEHKNVVGQPASQMEVHFSRQRQGVASWLAPSAPLGALDFFSSDATTAMDLLLKNPGEIFSDILNFASATNPASTAGLGQMEQSLDIDLKRDLLSKLSGEVAYEIEVPREEGGMPIWRVALRVNDVDGLQETLGKLMKTTHVEATRYEDSGFPLHRLDVPNGPRSVEIHYGFVDGYLLVAPSRTALTQSIKMHRSGQSLAKSAKFRDSVPAGHSTDASGFTYQNTASFLAPLMKQLAPDVAAGFPQFASSMSPSISWFYGDATSIRQASNSSAADAGMILVVAAVAIPNLLRSRIAANEAAAAASLRTINTAQVTYSVVYPNKGYARSLAVMGPGTGDCAEAAVTAQHACLLDGTLGAPSCSGDEWCVKGGYRYLVRSTCSAKTCDKYVAWATPVDSAKGTKSFCSVEDAVIRVKTGPPLTVAPTAAECRAWSPIN